MIGVRNGFGVRLNIDRNQGYHASRFVRGDNLARLCEEFRAERPDKAFAIVSNRVSMLEGSMTHASARGSNDLIGVAVMGSSTTYEFSHDDLLLFRTAASRVAALVAQARLDEAVRRHDAMQGSILSALGDLGEGFAIVEDGRMTVVTDALGRIVGRSREELLALPSLFDLIVPEIPLPGPCFA